MDLHLSDICQVPLLDLARTDACDFDEVLVVLMALSGNFDKLMEEALLTEVEAQQSFVHFGNQLVI